MSLSLLTGLTEANIFRIKLYIKIFKKTTI